MKKLMLMGILILVVMYPSIVLAGSAYWNATAILGDLSSLINCSGRASITYSGGIWQVSVNIKGLLPNASYIFQFGIMDQLANRADYPIASDKRGNVNAQLTITDLTTKLGMEEYSIIRTIDETGDSGGMILADLEPDGNLPDDDPYEGTSATMVMRAREDGVSGQLKFSKPRK